MTRSLGGHSHANITHHLKGLHVPAQKRDLVQQARRNGAEQDIMQVLEGMPEQEFASIAEVMREVVTDRGLVTRGSRTTSRPSAAR
jgi:hypothetical protein